MNRAVSIQCVASASVQARIESLIALRPHLPIDHKNPRKFDISGSPMRVICSSLWLTLRLGIGASCESVLDLDEQALLPTGRRNDQQLSQNVGRSFDLHR